MYNHGNYYDMSLIIKLLLSHHGHSSLVELELYIAINLTLCMIMMIAYCMISLSQPCESSRSL